jgi:hypothetical protein
MIFFLFFTRPQGNGVIELRSNILVSDGQWHDVKAQFNPAYMEVSVDGEKKSLRPRVGENKHIDLSGLLYFGGIEPGTKKQRAVDQGTVKLGYNELGYNELGYNEYSVITNTL